MGMNRGVVRDKILVTGATGRVGGALVQRLLESDVEIKAATRTPTAVGPAARRLEVVELDYDLTETWDAAVQWADRVFLVPPPFDPQADERLVPFLDWAVQSGTRHVVLLSAMGAEIRERMALRRVEERIERTGVAWTFLRSNVYMQNLARGFITRQIRREGVFRIPAGDGAVSFVDSRDVAAVAAAVLSGEDHFGRAYTLTGPEALTHGQAAALMADAAGRPVAYEPASDDDLRGWLGDAGWPADQAETFVRLFASIRAGDRAAVTPEAERLLGRAAVRFEEFARDHAGAWR
jgi:uncharacterized protein YbjT (DUF2867 family)